MKGQRALDLATWCCRRQKMCRTKELVESGKRVETAATVIVVSTNARLKTKGTAPKGQGKGTYKSRQNSPRRDRSPSQRRDASPRRNQQNDERGRASLRDSPQRRDTRETCRQFMKGNCPRGTNCILDIHMHVHSTREATADKVNIVISCTPTTQPKTLGDGTLFRMESISESTAQSMVQAPTDRKTRNTLLQSAWQHK